MNKFLLLTAGLVTIGATVVFAGPRCHKHHTWNETKMEKKIKKHVKKMTRRLDLSPEQAKEVEQILRAKSTKILALANEHRTEMKSIRSDFKNDIHVVLNDQQKTKFDKHMKKRQKKHRL